MSEPFIGELKVISWNFAPKGWALCNGQLLPISQNQALFSVLGTTYGGDGRVNFGLPNLQGRTPMHAGSGIVLGQQGGEIAHTLNIPEIPAHTHVPNGATTLVNSSAPNGNNWGSGSQLTPFSNGQPNLAMAPPAISSAGGSQPHNNMQPYLVLNVIIALQGIFPSPN